MTLNETMKLCLKKFNDRHKFCNELDISLIFLPFNDNWKYKNSLNNSKTEEFNNEKM